jgi:two-component system, OmpR family, alkaline phosphatase synthesis response regulator PhoP
MVTAQVRSDLTNVQSSDGKKQVLVVDDDPMVVKVLRDSLERVGYRVRTAYHGLEALQVVKDQRPDLIILDILMPMLDGFKVARILKFDKRFQSIPIVVLTSRATEGERKMGQQVGADEFLFKPFRLPQVLDVVNRYLNA